MSSSVLVNRAELLDLVDQARDVLPSQLSRADEVLADADDASVGRPGGRDALLAQARAQAAALVDREAVVVAAQERAAELVDRPSRRPRASSGTPTTTATVGWRTSRSTWAGC